MPARRNDRRPADLEDRKALERFPLWGRLLSRIPLPLWYAFGSVLAWLGEHVIRYRRKVIDAQLRRCFPDWDDAAVARTRRAFYLNFVDVVVESVKAVTLDADELRRRVEVTGIERVREHIAAGRSVVLLTSHTCNWEWTLLILSLELGVPMDAAYKPLKDEWADRLFLTIRSRFGANMIPAKRLLMHLLRRRKEPRVIAMVADQDPVSAAVRHFTTFFGHETAFYMGPEAIARAARAPTMYIAVERTARGRYHVALEPLVGHEAKLPEGGIVEAYARRVEQQIRAHPADWLWAYRRWKVRRNVYGGGVARKEDN